MTDLPDYFQLAVDITNAHARMLLAKDEFRFSGLTRAQADNYRRELNMPNVCYQADGNPLHDAHVQQWMDASECYTCRRLFMAKQGHTDCPICERYSYEYRESMRRIYRDWDEEQT